MSMAVRQPATVAFDHVEDLFTAASFAPLQAAAGDLSTPPDAPGLNRLD
jgi:hypothetical protein